MPLCYAFSLMRSSLVLLLLLAGAAPAAAQSGSEDIEVIDQGNFVLFLKDRAIGAETFGIAARSDSINSIAHSYLKTRTQSGEELMEKQMVMTATRDFALRFYQSNETSHGKTIVTGVLTGGDEDTAFTIFREEKDGAGLAHRMVAPPGRFFVLDPGIYSLFNLICLNLHGKVFATRPISLLTLSAGRDTVVEAQVTDLGTETIRWGARPIQARKFELKDRGTVFQVWAGPTGKMLRLTHELSGLRVERGAPPVKGRAAPKSKPGG
jgi:hypothetical protein